MTTEGVAVPACAAPCESFVVGVESGESLLGRWRGIDLSMLAKREGGGGQRGFHRYFA